MLKSISEITSEVYFNSAISSNFKDLYDKIIYDKYKEKENRIPSKPFAPSSFRCDRSQFFRIRGVEPDKDINIDKELEFTAELGTFCHKLIQKNLAKSIKNQWISVPEYLESSNIDHEYVVKSNGYETLVEFLDIPIKFACDGIIRIDDEYYLLEIKTAEHQSFQRLSKPKDNHIDQVNCYCSLLGLNKVLFLYQDRSYGEIKVFEYKVTTPTKNEVFKKINKILDCVENSIAPPRLPKGDWWCNTCVYKKRCEQWG